MPTLKRNLTALAKTQPQLAERICWPVDDTHVPVSQGRYFYRYRRTLHPLEIAETALMGLLPVDETETRRLVFIFGLGLGETLNAAVWKYPQAQIQAWERDPWLLRLVLQTYDFSEVIRSGRLLFYLGADLADLVPVSRETQVVPHPFLYGVYQDEWKLLSTGTTARCAVLCEGEWYVDDLAEALHEEGYAVYRLDIHILSLEEMGLTLARLKPEFVSVINYHNGLAELCRRHNTQLLCWEIDPAIEKLAPCKVSTRHAHMFTYRKISVPRFKAAGFKNTIYCPLATNPKHRRHIELPPTEREHYAVPVSFVGSSLQAQAEKNQEAFLQHYASFRAGDPGAREAGKAILEKLLAEQRKDFSRFLIPLLLRKYLADFEHDWRKTGQREDLAVLLGEISASEKRLAYAAALGPQGLYVWGDEGWCLLENQGVNYRGPAGHFSQLNKIYSASHINLDIKRLYEADIVTMRIYDILACGGFVLTEKNASLAELFRPGKEVEVYASLLELKDKVHFYLNHPDSARFIARKGQEVVLKNHTISQRLHLMLTHLTPRSVSL